MNRPLTILFTAISLFLLSAKLINACEIVVIQERKEFRNAKRVFVGEIVSVKRVEDSVLVKKMNSESRFLDLIKFKIERSWKGQKTKFIDVYVEPYCLCPYRDFNFKTGQKFLVSVNKYSFASSCDTLFIEADSDNAARKKYFTEWTERLDSFWFRTWASVYPF